MVYTNSPSLGMKSCPYCAEDIREAAVRCKHCGSWLDGPPEREQGGPRFDADFASAVGPSKAPWETSRRPLRRSTRSRMFLGVCGGVAESLGIDATYVRLAFVALWAFTAFIPMTAAYFVMALVVPRDTDSTPW